MSIDRLIESWKDARNGLIDEAAQIPPEQFSFRPTPETRTIAELLQHVVESQKTFVGETARPDTNIFRQPLEGHAREYAPEAAGITDKNGLLELLRSSMETSEASIRAAGDRLQDKTKGFRGNEVAKFDLLTFAVSHEMYHRGQLTVYERLLKLEPVLTQRFREMSAKAAANKATPNAS
jgi:uncharacterized damage-inducible protein DinB